MAVSLAAVAMTPVVVEVGVVGVAGVAVRARAIVDFATGTGDVDAGLTKTA